MEQAKRDRRTHVRWVVGGRAAGRISAIHEATIIDISLGGALIEHTSMVSVGTTSPLILTIHGREVILKCRVVRSAVHRFEVRPDGERELIRRTGVEFLDISEDVQHLLGEYITSLREEN